MPNVLRTRYESLALPLKRNVGWKVHKTLSSMSDEQNLSRRIVRVLTLYSEYQTALNDNHAQEAVALRKTNWLRWRWIEESNACDEVGTRKQNCLHPLKTTPAACLELFRYALLIE